MDQHKKAAPGGNREAAQLIEFHENYSTDYEEYSKLSNAELLRRYESDPGSFNYDAYEKLKAERRAAEQDDFFNLDSAVEPEEIDEPDFNLAAPTPSAEMLYGFAGDVGKAAAEGSESNPYAVAMDMLVMLSAEFGRDVFLPIGDRFHHPRLFGLHVGRSGRGRKGDALSLPLRIRNKARSVHANLDAGLFGQLHTGGLSSREGIVTLIHDGYKVGKQEEPAIDDKRLMVVESEFANILHQTKRDGNTLSAALRDAWDGADIKPLTKSAKIGATDPHIALLGHVTPSELTGLMKSRELSNGFANRFLMFWAERDRLVPFPVHTPEQKITDLAYKFAGIVKFAKGSYPETCNSRQAQLTDAAKAAYDGIYYDLCKSIDGGLIDGILERRAPILLRLALLFAITDKTLDIDVGHIGAAKAWIDYATESVRFIFESGEREAKASETSDTARKILEFIRASGEVTKTKISTDLFKYHKTAAEINSALQFLLAESPPLIEIETKKGTGRPAKFYRLPAKKAKKAKKANYIRNQSVIYDNEPQINCKKSKKSPDDKIDEGLNLHNLHNLHNLQAQKKPESRASSNNLLNLHNLPASNEKSEVEL